MFYDDIVLYILINVNHKEINITTQQRLTELLDIFFMYDIIIVIIHKKESL